MAEPRPTARWDTERLWTSEEVVELLAAVIAAWERVRPKPPPANRWRLGKNLSDYHVRQPGGAATVGSRRPLSASPAASQRPRTAAGIS